MWFLFTLLVLNLDLSILISLCWRSVHHLKLSFFSHELCACCRAQFWFIDLVLAWCLSVPVRKDLSLDRVSPSARQFFLQLPSCLAPDLVQRAVHRFSLCRSKFPRAKKPVAHTWIFLPPSPCVLSGSLSPWAPEVIFRSWFSTVVYLLGFCCHGPIFALVRAPSSSHNVFW
jgi:hypothetical protein